MLKEELGPGLLQGWCQRSALGVQPEGTSRRGKPLAGQQGGECDGVWEGLANGASASNSVSGLRASVRYNMARLLLEERKRRATCDERLAHGPTTGSGDQFGKSSNTWVQYQGTRVPVPGYPGQYPGTLAALFPAFGCWVPGYPGYAGTRVCENESFRSNRGGDFNGSAGIPFLSSVSSEYRGTRVPGYPGTQ
eukprot:1666239-Rhodomonas_salina.1